MHRYDKDLLANRTRPRRLKSSKDAAASSPDSVSHSFPREDRTGDGAPRTEHMPAQRSDGFDARIARTRTAMKEQPRCGGVLLGVWRGGLVLQTGGRPPRVGCMPIQKRDLRSVTRGGGRALTLKWGINAPLAIRCGGARLRRHAQGCGSIRGEAGRHLDSGHVLRLGMGLELADGRLGAASLPGQMRYAIALH